MRYPEEASRDRGDKSLQGSIFIIDPKSELRSAVEHINRTEGLRRSIVHLNCDDRDWAIWLFDDVDAKALTGREVLESILSVSADYAFQRTHTREAFFVLTGERLLETLIDADLEIFRTGGRTAVARFWTELAARVRKQHGAAIQPGEFLGRLLSVISLGAALPAQSVYSLHAALLREFGVGEVVSASVLSLGDMAVDTYSSVVATLRGMIGDVSSARFLTHVGIDPFGPPECRRLFDFRGALSRGDIVVHSARSRSASESAIGRALKSQYFAAVFAGITDRPTYYVCDEAQRYISTDPTSGEQSYLDRARAFRASCMLATQSIASLRYAIATSHDGAGVSSALDVILANTATKLFFRSTDPGTRNQLRDLLPVAPTTGRPHVIDVRPPSTLSVGECYYIMARGDWGRRQVTWPLEVSNQ